MFLHTCKYCGLPSVECSDAPDGIARCLNCGSLNDVPYKQLPANAMTELDAANAALFKCYFDTARELYSRVIKLAPDCPQGYFGRALTDFKVNYLGDMHGVNAPESYRPICYADMDRLFSNDLDYVKAMELATPAQREQYSKQAADIDRIVSVCRAFREKGVSYDVFICCNFTDATGQKTADGVYARDLYNRLIKKGLKPFCCTRKIDESFVGSEYEAVILYALRSAKSMIVVCSDEDSLKTPRVESECKRFLTITLNDYKNPGSLMYVYNGKSIEQLDRYKFYGVDRNEANAFDKIVSFVRECVSDSPDENTICVKCNKKFPLDFNFCPHCGNKTIWSVEKNIDDPFEWFIMCKKEREYQSKNMLVEFLSRLTDAEGSTQQKQTAHVNEAAVEIEADKYLQYKLNEDGSSYTVVGCNRVIKTVSVPAKHKDLPVTGIGKFAFAGCGNMVFVRISDSVTSIGKGAFQGDGNLISVNIPDGVTSIARYAFDGCGSLFSITIPKGVTCIEDKTFSNCGSLRSANIPEGVTSIGEYAFSGCASLASVTIPDSVTSIGEYAFSGCGKLSAIDIPSKITSIGRFTFSGCSFLMEVKIPDNVTSIESYAFGNCNNLRFITIPNSVTSIDEDAFFGCYDLRGVTLPRSLVGFRKSKLRDIFGEQYKEIKFTFTK